MSVRVGVVVFPGSNCDRTRPGPGLAGAEPVEPWHESPDLAERRRGGPPGGFAYGDYLRAGVIARFSPVMRAVAAFAARGGLVLGIATVSRCWRRQASSPARSCATGACASSAARLPSPPSGWTRRSRTSSGRAGRCGCRSPTGRAATSPDAATLDALERDGQVLFRYVRPDGARPATLGSATVLCVDKTGTLTQNKMTVHSFFAAGQLCVHDAAGNNSVPEICHEVAEFAILACKKDPFDPMEKALFQLRDGEFGTTEHIHTGWELITEYPLSQNLMAMSNVWRSPAGNEFVIAAKGAPEAIADLCHFDEEKRQALAADIDSMAVQGLRILGVAKALFTKPELPDGQHDFTFTFLGLVGFADPVRPLVADAVRECYTAGMRVIMITGDYPLTAQNIGRQIGLAHTDQCITGSELEQMSEAELKERIRTATLFARAVPEQKLRIVNALKANGEVVAMTGDGVNDAPALKSADIGIAMGGRGTDVARESSSLVLLDDNFTSIVSAVRLGRRIFDNLKKAMAYIFSIHVPIAGMSLIPVLFNMPLVLLPVHIVFLELIIDPACSVVFESEKEEPDVMNRPPRHKDEGLFTKKTLALSLLQGFVVLAVVLSHLR